MSINCLLVNCAVLSDVTDGSVSLSGTTVGSIATYFCDAGFSLSGSDVRTCQNDGQWSGTEPTCDGMCTNVIFFPMCNIPIQTCMCRHCLKWCVTGSSTSNVMSYMQSRHQNLPVSILLNHIHYKYVNMM